jgi:hypothetical protein
MPILTVSKAILFGVGLVVLAIPSTPHSLTFIAPVFANDRVHKDSYISFKTNDGRRFSISESGWYLINKTNAAPKNATMSTATASALAQLKEFSKFNPIYNYLVNPETIEGSDGDHVLVTVASTIGRGQPRAPIWRSCGGLTNCIWSVRSRGAGCCAISWRAKASRSAACMWPLS